MMFTDIALDGSEFEKIAHYITIVGNLGIFTALTVGFKRFLKMYKGSLKLSERVDHLWKDFCSKHDLEYVPIEED